jgi:hypothetical protein
MLMLPGDWRLYDQTQRDKFEAWGADGTRRALIEGKLGEQKGRIATAWLAEQNAASDAEQREIDRNIARGANRIAGQARTRATWANIFAGSALIVAIAAAVTDWLK